MTKRKLNEEQSRRITHTHNTLYLLMRYWQISVDLDESDNRDWYDVGFALYDSYDDYSSILSLFTLVMGFYDAAKILQGEYISEAQKTASTQYSFQKNENQQHFHRIFTELSTGEQLDLTQVKPSVSLDC